MIDIFTYLQANPSLCKGAAAVFGSTLCQTVTTPTSFKTTPAPNTTPKPVVREFPLAGTPALTAGNGVKAQVAVGPGKK